MMKKLVFALLILPAPAFAEDAIIFADCKEGGCTCHISAISAEEIALVTGQPTPADAAQQTLVLHDGQFIWSRTPRDDIDLVMGGDGTCEIAIFQPIVPQDGSWKGSVRVNEISGCLPQVAEMVPPLVDDMGNLKQIAWGGKFHPSHFVVGNAPDGIRWTERSPTQFDGVFPIPPNGTLDVSVTATATLVAPDRAEATLALRLSAAPGVDAAALAVLGMADCKVDAIYDFERVGP